MKEEKYNLETNFVRFRKNGISEIFNVDQDFYKNLSSGKLGDFKDEILISLYTFEEDCKTWEIHPKGDELVFLISGDLDFILRENEKELIIKLNIPNTFIIVPKNTWHTAKINSKSSVLFITQGEGTENKLK